MISIVSTGGGTEYSSVGAISILPLPYRGDGCSYFAQLRPLDGAVLLDSARVHGAGGRFDLMSALPVCELATRGAITRITRGSTTVLSASDPFALVAQALAEHFPGGEAPGGEWPFAGGAIGWFGYDLGRRMARLAPRDPAPAVADMQIGIYGWALLQDHERAESVALFTGGRGRGNPAPRRRAPAGARGTRARGVVAGVPVPLEFRPRRTTPVPSRACSAISETATATR